MEDNKRWVWQKVGAEGGLEEASIGRGVRTLVTLGEREKLVQEKGPGASLPRTELIAYPKNSVTTSTLPFKVISFFVPTEVAAIFGGKE